jgi:phosphoenolpyruvate carboxykinase (GTP)
VLARVHGEVGAAETPIGFIPHPTGIDVTGLDISPEALRELFAVDRSGWLEAVAGQQDFFNKFGDRLPQEIWQESEALAKRLQA